MRKAGPLTSRVAAAQALAQLLGKGESLSTALPPLLNKVETIDRGFVQEMTFGVARYYQRLQACLKPLLRQPLKAADLDLQCLLLVGAYQLLYLDTPPHAAINEAVEGARSLNKPWATGLINAVLRNLMRRKDELLASADQQPEARYSHPQWMLKHLQKSWPQHWQDIVAANNAKAPLTLRVNLRQGDRDSFLKRLQAADIAAQPTRFSRTGVQLANPIDVLKIPGFSDGDCSVQDEAAQLCTQLLDLQPGQRVLDACAAPGGKTCAILEAEPALTEVWAVDVDAQRLQRVRDNLQRLHLQCQVKVADLSVVNALGTDVSFDRILLDAPCSGTGVIRRHPDIKLLRRATDIPALAETQALLLERCWQMLKPGGILVYATCAMFPEENSHIIERFIAKHPEARLDPLAVDWGIACAGGRQLFPDPQAHDGFFYARLYKDAA